MAVDPTRTVPATVVVIPVPVPVPVGQDGTVYFVPVKNARPVKQAMVLNNVQNVANAPMAIVCAIVCQRMTVGWAKPVKCVPVLAKPWKVWIAMVKALATSIR